MNGQTKSGIPRMEYFLAIKRRELLNARYNVDKEGRSKRHTIVLFHLY